MVGLCSLGLEVKAENEKKDRGEKGYVPWF